MDGSTPPCCPHNTGDYWKTCLQGLNERGITQVTIGKKQGTIEGE